MSDVREAGQINTRIVRHVDLAKGERAELTRVPTSVPATKIKAFLADLGFDLNDLPRGGGGVYIGWPAITATIYARNAEGTMFIDGATNEIAMHRIVIPITDDDLEAR